MKDGIKSFGLSRLERGFCSFFYDDQKHFTRQRLELQQVQHKQTSVIGAAAVVARHTFMTAVTVKDWNFRVIIGDTCTGTWDKGRWRFGLGKSLAGTGAVSALSTQVLGTQANGTVIDVTGSDVSFAAGDDIVLYYIAGTALPAAFLEIGADIDYVETFAA